MSLLHLLRKTRDWTQIDLAREAGIDQARIARIEKDHRPLKLQRYEHLTKIAAAFKLTPVDLIALTDRDTPPPDPQERRRLGQTLRAAREKKKRRARRPVSAAPPSGDTVSP